MPTTTSNASAPRPPRTQAERRARITANGERIAALEKDLRSLRAGLASFKADLAKSRDAQARAIPKPARRGGL